jgi:2-dehydro-3-deoxyglucarate aldolase
MINKRKLLSKKTIGAWISIPDAAIAEIFANAGFDWVVIDLEHTTTSIQQAGELIRIIDLAGSIPLVRLTKNDKNLIKRVLDAGAQGIIVPNVVTREDAIRAVQATRYQPIGNRGVGLGRAQGYGSTFSEYYQWQKDDGPIVIAQIEDKSALDNLNEIFTTQGIDGFIIGPYDLSCSMGIPGKFDNPEFIIAVEIILKKAKNAKCPSGIHIVEPDINLLKSYAKKGYQLIAYGVDMRMLDLMARDGVSEFKKTKK